MSFPAAWSRRSKMTVYGGNLPEQPPENFIVLIRSSSLPEDFFTYVREDGGDIRFSLDANGLAQLPSEMVYFDKVNKKCEIWVKLTGITLSDYDFYIWYGNLEAIPEKDDYLFGRYRTWRDDFQCVFHLQSKVVSTEVIGENAEYDPLNNYVTVDIGGENGKVLSFDRDGDTTFLSVLDGTSLGSTLSPPSQTDPFKFISNSAASTRNLINDDYYGYTPVWVGNGYQIVGGYDTVPKVHGTSAFPASLSCVLDDIDYYTEDKQVLFFSGDSDTGRANYFIYKTPDNKIGIFSNPPAGSVFYEYRTDEQVFDLKQTVYFGFRWDPPNLPEIYIDGIKKDLSVINPGQSQFYSVGGSLVIGDIPQKTFSLPYAGDLWDFKPFTGKFDEIRLSNKNFSFPDEYVNYFSNYLVSASDSEDINYSISFDIIPSRKGPSIFYVTLIDTSVMPSENYTRVWKIINTLDGTEETIESNEKSINKAFKGKIEGQKFYVTLEINLG